MDRKGQESAPFELLIAVIIMGFVIYVGFIAMGRLAEERCNGIIDSKLEEMKTKLEVAVRQKSPQSISFILSECYNPKDEEIKIEDSDNPKTCADYCGAAMNNCTLLKYWNQGPGGFVVIKCLGISPDTAFPSMTGGRCQARDGFELVDFSTEIVQGRYELLNKSYATDTFPTICAYRRTGA